MSFHESLKYFEPHFPVSLLFSNAVSNSGKVGNQTRMFGLKESSIFYLKCFPHKSLVLAVC